MMNQTSNPGPESAASGLPVTGEQVNQDLTREMIIPVIEEQVHVDKKVVESGRVRITKVVSEQEVPVSIPLIEEEHDIQRVPVNEYVETAPPPIRYEGDTMIIPVVREVLVIQKRLLVVEELHITKTQVQKQDTQHITLRKEEVMVQHLAPDQPGDLPG
jgi:uncharacterized protein (TIGR02271 family)